MELKEFLKALLDPEIFGWAVSEEVRKEAKRQLEAYEDHNRD